MLAKLVDIQYERNDVDFAARASSACAATASRSGPSYEEFAFRIEFWGDEVEQLSIINPDQRRGDRQLAADCSSTRPSTSSCPRSGSTTRSTRSSKELDERLEQFQQQGKLLEAQRLNARTRFDIEMMQEVGYCPGIENYSRPLTGRAPGEPPDTLFNFFPDDFLLFVDESHVTVPQIRGDVRRRPQPQDDAGRARLPAAQRAGQPAAEVRRMGGADQPGGLRLGHARPATNWSRPAARSSSR